MDNYPTSHLALSELVSQVLNDPKASDRERDLAERIDRASAALRGALPQLDQIGRGDRG